MVGSVTTAYPYIRNYILPYDILHITGEFLSYILYILCSFDTNIDNIWYSNLITL